MKYQTIINNLMKMDNGNKTQMKISEARATASNLVKMNANWMLANKGRWDGPLGALLERSKKLAKKMAAKAARDAKKAAKK